MTKLKLLSATRLERLLLSLGFVKVRQKGSHVFYRHADGRTTAIPHSCKLRFATPTAASNFARNPFER